jgi:hypothetical protein
LYLTKLSDLSKINRTEKKAIITKLPVTVYSSTSVVKICIVFQLDGNTLVKDKVLQEANDMIKFARSNGRQVDENQVKTALSECGNQGKYYRTVGISLCFNF